MTPLEEFKGNYIDNYTKKIFPFTWEQLKPKLERLIEDSIPMDAPVRGEAGEKIIIGDGTTSIATTQTYNGGWYLVMERNIGTGVIGENVQNREMGTIIDLANINGCAIEIKNKEGLKVLVDKLNYIDSQLSR